MGSISVKNINLLVSGWCNLHCKMCDYRLKAFARKELKFNEISDLLHDAVKLGLERLDLSGGEPMVRKDIFDIICLARSLGVRVLLVTNGVLIGEQEAQKLVESGVNAVIISLEGFEETNDFVRGNGNYKKALKAINILKKYEDSLDYINVGVTVSKLNYRQLYDFTKFLMEDVGVHSVSYNPFDKDMLNRENFDSVKDIFSIPLDLVEDLNDQLLKIISYKKSSQKPLPPESYIREIRSYFEGKKIRTEFPCYAPSTGCGIDSSGQVFPCWGEGVAVGNITEKSLEEIVNSKEYIDICKRGITMNCKGCLKSCYVGHYS